MSSFLSNLLRIDEKNRISDCYSFESYLLVSEGKSFSKQYLPFFDFFAQGI